MATQLIDYLSAMPHIRNVAPVVLYLDGRRYEGAAYDDDGGAKWYFIGALPPSYRRSSRTAYVIGGADYYIACYMPAARITPQYAPYHPFGETFMLCRWNVPDGGAIDKYEVRPYNRVYAFLMSGTLAQQESGINLDGFATADELMEFWNVYHRGGRRRGAELFPSRPAGYLSATRALANYAANKATAMRCRARGDIGIAAHYERIAARIYDGLPAFARW